MSSSSLPPSPQWSDPGDTSITISWEPPVMSVASVELQVREFPKPWEEARKISVPASTASYEVTGLIPQSTYEFRLVYIGQDGSRLGPGPSVSADTQAVGCTPKAKAKKQKRQGAGCAVQ